MLSLQSQARKPRKKLRCRMGIHRDNPILDVSWHVSRDGNPSSYTSIEEVCSCGHRRKVRFFVRARSVLIEGDYR